MKGSAHVTSEPFAWLGQLGRKAYALVNHWEQYNNQTFAFHRERSPWLREEMERQNWHVLKWQHLDTLAAREGARMEWLEPVLGLDPLIERGGEQLTMFGE